MQTIKLHNESISCVPKHAIVKNNFSLEEENKRAISEANYEHMLIEDEQKWQREIWIEELSEERIENINVRAGDRPPSGPTSYLCWWYFEVKQKRIFQ